MAVIGTAYEKAGSPGTLVETRDRLSLTREFIVKTSSRSDGPVTVMGAAGLPLIGNVYVGANGETHPYLFCTQRTPRRINDKSKNWIVTCEYETPQAGGQKPDTPEFELPDIRTDSHSVTVEMFQDINGDHIANSAGDPFKPAHTEQIDYPALFITRNEPVTSPIIATQAAYQGKKNSDTFWGEPAGKWRCNRIRSRLAHRTLSDGTRQNYLIVDYEFLYKPTWNFQPLDKGYYYINGSGDRIANRTADGKEIEGLLDGSTGAAALVPQYLDFEVLDDAAFSGLQLPQSYLDAVY